MFTCISRTWYCQYIIMSLSSNGKHQYRRMCNRLLLRKEYVKQQQIYPVETVKLNLSTYLLIKSITASLHVLSDKAVLYLHYPADFLFYSHLHKTKMIVCHGLCSVKIKILNGRKKKKMRDRQKKKNNGRIFVKDTQ